MNYTEGSQKPPPPPWAMVALLSGSSLLAFLSWLLLISAPSRTSPSNGSYTLSYLQGMSEGSRLRIHLSVLTSPGTDRRERLRVEMFRDMILDSRVKCFR